MTGPLTLCAHLAYLFTELPFEKRFPAAASAGFEVIEHPDPYPLRPADSRKLCKDNGLRPAQIAFPSGRDGEKGLAAIAGRETEFADTLADAVGCAVEIGCPLIHPMAGEPADGTDREISWQTYCQNIRLSCRTAAVSGLTVIIEPGSVSLPRYFMDHPALALEAITAVGLPNLKLSFDAFHAYRAGVDLAAFVREHADIIAHVQVADHPGRHEPGTATIPFDQFFTALRASSFSGTVGLEYVPRRTTFDGLDWANDHAAVSPLGRTRVGLNQRFSKSP